MDKINWLVTLIMAVVINVASVYVQRWFEKWMAKRSEVSKQRQSARQQKVLAAVVRLQANPNELDQARFLCVQALLLFSTFLVLGFVIGIGSMLLLASGKIGMLFYWVGLTLSVMLFTLSTVFMREWMSRMDIIHAASLGLSSLSTETEKS